MAEYITSIKTKQGNKRIDYNALANLPSLEANNITYNNLSTDLVATNTQAALDEIVAQIQKMSVDYVTNSELSTRGYLTSVPSEYITETELDKKGYLTEHQDISNKANKATTLSGYGITDGTTKAEFNQLMETVNDIKIDIGEAETLLEAI